MNHYWTMRDSGLYVPGAYGPNTGMHTAAQSLHGLGEFGGYFGSEYLPSGINFPREKDYAKGLIDAVSENASSAMRSFDGGGEFNPPFMDQVASLKATLEATTGISLSQLHGLARNVMNLVGATNPVAIGSAVSSLILGTLDIVVSGLKAAGVALEAIKIVPILGQIIGMVAGVVVDILESQANYKIHAQNCQKRVEEDRKAFCSKAMSDSNPQKTDVDGVQPGDMFRPVMYAMQKSGPLPLTPVSLYVALCGGETQGAFKLFDRNSWRRALDAYHKKTGRRHIGVPQQTQRRMWSLIKGIMSASQNPTIGIVFAPGDNGKALMPLLQDITRNLWLVGNGLSPQRGEYGVDQNFLQWLEGYIGAQYYKYIECPDLSEGEMAAGAMPAGGMSCTPFMQLWKPFVGAIKDFELGLVKHNVLNADMSWNTGGVGNKKMILFGKGLTPTGRLTIDGSAAEQLLDTASLSRAAAVASEKKKKAKRDYGRKAAGWTTAVIVGGGGFMLARKAAKKRRRA